MLIHIGQNKFVDFKHCELIINLLTVDEETQKRVLAAMPEPEEGSEYHAAIRTTNGRWIGSTLSPEALAQRGICHPFTDAAYLKEEWKTSSQYRY
ncbi:MAG: hypothetical protein KKB51_00105 [Candidatus Riflebacteria bacterium]|nr:hypothetical protein [Candidatus Riflebacteria bacterium]